MNSINKWYLKKYFYVGLIKNLKCLTQTFCLPCEFDLFHITENMIKMVRHGQDSNCD